jgi:ceramide glucosyltransferase
MLAWLLAALVAGSAVFCLLVIAAARPSASRQTQSAATPVSILKPLAGADLDLASNLSAAFEQNHPAYEILFAVRDPSDPAIPIVERLQSQYPRVPARLLITGEPPYPNPKVFALEQMTAAARHDLLAMCDSDIRIPSDFLHRIAAEFADPRLGLTTCPYRAVPEPTFWSRLEAIMMNTEFLAGILVARMIEGMRFAVGPTIVARKSAIDAIGGWTRLKAYLAEDFMLGQFAARAGIGVGLSSVIVEHHIAGPGETFASNVEHRLRWCRSTRRSRPAGYVGQLFTNPTPLALALLAAAPAWWPLAAFALALRAAAAYATAGRILHDPLCKRYWYLIPVADLASFAFWIAGFFGNSIRWRGRTYYLHRDGTFERTA